MSHPQYEAVPLAREEISLCVVQSRVRAVDARNRDASLGENLAHMLGLIDAANGWLGPKNLVMFHEFPLTGFDARWSREELLKVIFHINKCHRSSFLAVYYFFCSFLLNLTRSVFLWSK